MTNFRPVVLSGGGSRGAYGAGVLLGLQKFQRSIPTEVNFYCGTSVGALNAVLAAQDDVDPLLALYSKLKTKDVIGADSSEVGVWGMTKAFSRDPFYYFDNKALARLITKHVNFKKLEANNAHVAICATNYTTGDLETFYFSSLIDRFRKEDKKKEVHQQRLSNYRRIESQERLIEALLASTAIPFFLPPFKIDGATYVDGGVGNNTATRQAAFFCRFLNDLHLGTVMPAICVINDPVSFAIDEQKSKGLQPLVLRTSDLFQHELVQDTLLTWERINREFSHLENQTAKLNAAVDSVQGLSQQQIDQLKTQIQSIMMLTTGGTPRLDLKKWEVRPNPALGVKDLLTFDPAVSKELRKRGTSDFLGQLHAMGQIDQAKRDLWIAESDAWQKPEANKK